MKIIKDAIHSLIEFCQSKIETELWPSGPTGSEYLEGLVRISPEGETRGSFVEGLDTLDKTIKFLNSLSWERVTVPNSIQFGNSEYYQAVLPDGYVAFQNVIRLKDAQQDVNINWGKHGDELTSRSSGGRRPTKVVSAIVEDGMLSTWYPGEFTARSPEILPDSRKEWNEDWAVKLVEWY